MIKPLRKLRTGLLEKGQWSKYLLYSIGEILLVIIGILVAIQVDNWNNERKERSQLHATLDQVYTVFDRDLDRLVALRSGYEKQVAVIDSITLNPKAIEPKLLPYKLYYLDLGYETLTTEAADLVRNLNLDPDDIRQRNLAKAISEYERNFKTTTYFNKEFMTPVLQQKKLPQPTLINLSESFEGLDLKFFNDEEVALVQELLDDPLLHRALKSARNEKIINIRILDFNIEIIKAKKAAIKDYFPEVVLLYRKIGLIGTASPYKNWEQDVDLQPTDPTKAIWECDVKLEDGFVKFREGGDWTINWGGKDFPSGKTIYYDDAIKVNAGEYHVVFNLYERTYQFTRKEN